MTICHARRRGVRRGSARARRTSYGPDATGSRGARWGHRPAVRGRGAECGRPVVASRAGTGTTAGRRSAERGKVPELRTAARADVPRPAPAEDVTDLPRDELGEQPVRRGVDRTSRNNGDLKGGHLNHTGPVYPAADWGDIIPPYAYVDENGQDPDLPRATTGARRDRRSTRTAATCRRRRTLRGQSQSRRSLECVERRGRRHLRRPLRLREPERDDRRAAGAARTSSRPAPADRGQPRRSRRAASTDAFQVDVGRERAHVVADRERCVRFGRLEALRRRLDHGHQAARPRRTTPASST